MSLSAVVDNDILIKGACYALLGEIANELGGTHAIGILGAARYVVGDRLRKADHIQDRARALADWQAFVAVVESLEPTDSEIDLATSIETEAALAQLPLDPGESQLAAIVVVRLLPVLVTGDKRAIQALEELLQRLNDLSHLAGRVLCAEQLMGALVSRLGLPAVRLSVCSEPGADKAISICFQCRSSDLGAADILSGLSSYIESLRAVAPSVLS